MKKENKKPVEVNCPKCKKNMFLDPRYNGLYIDWVHHDEQNNHVIILVKMIKPEKPKQDRYIGRPAE